MDLRTRFGLALKAARKRLQVTQEDFSAVSSRTYLSTLERGLKTPTIEKLEQLASVLGVHPVALLAVAYLDDSGTNADELCIKVRADISAMTGR